MTIDSLEPSSGQLAISDSILGLLGKLSFLRETAMGVLGSCGVEAVAKPSCYQSRPQLEVEGLS